MDDSLWERLQRLRLLRVVEHDHEFYVEQLDPETGTIGVVTGPGKIALFPLDSD